MVSLPCAKEARTLAPCPCLARRKRGLRLETEGIETEGIQTEGIETEGIETKVSKPRASKPRASKSRASKSRDPSTVSNREPHVNWDARANHWAIVGTGWQKEKRIWRVCLVYNLSSQLG